MKKGNVSNAAGPRESKRQLVLHKLEKLAASTPYSSEAETARAKLEQLKIHRVIVQVAPATDGGNPGEGYYQALRCRERRHGGHDGCRGRADTSPGYTNPS
jgi:hypothetical protein